VVTVDATVAPALAKAFHNHAILFDLLYEDVIPSSAH
jgi:hypothetical protein